PRCARDAGLTGPAREFAPRQRSSPFMVLLAAYQVLLHRAPGAEDLVVPTITAGRGQVQFDETVGPFFNFLPLRTSLAGCGTVRDALLRTRSACLQAQSHEIPCAHILAEAPGLMDPFAANDRAVSAIQVFQHPFGADGEMGEDLRYAEIRRRLRSAPVSAGIPDGVLWTLDVDPPYGILGNVKFNRNEFDESTVAGLVDGFVRVLREIVSSPDSPLRDRACRPFPASNATEYERARRPGPPAGSAAAFRSTSRCRRLRRSAPAAPAGACGQPFRTSFRMCRNSSNEDRSGTVQPSRSYSARHWST